MSLFNNLTHQEIWIEHHCHQCWRNPGCPILGRALRTGRKPVEWKRNVRKNALMQDSMKCNEETQQPPSVKRTKAFDDVPMFDVEAVHKREDVDHA